MNGKVCVVTGGNSGIGFETARGLDELGARVVIVSRNREKGEAAAERIGRGAELVVGDLGTLSTTRALAAALVERYPRIDVLVNNAGVYRVRRTLTPDGLEEMFAVNHLAPFLLTNLLLDRLKESAPARIVTVASEASRGLRLDFEDLQSEHGYKMQSVYGKSKLANIMFTYAMARRLQGTGVTINALHPGFVATNLGSGNFLPQKPVMALLRLFVSSPRQGAETPIYLASSPDVEGINGRYFEKKRERKSTPFSYDEAAQETLWETSARLSDLA